MKSLLLPMINPVCQEKCVHKHEKEITETVLMTR